MPDIIEHGRSELVLGVVLPSVWQRQSLACCTTSRLTGYFPQPRFRVPTSVYHGLFETIYTTLGKSGLLGKVSNALCGVVTRTLEKPRTFLPKSYVGQFSKT